jgi:phosphinothricin acetyltransferase
MNEIASIIDCDESHSAAILAIVNEAILNSTAIYDYRPRTMESMSTWFAAKRQGDFPVLGALSATGELTGFASYGSFRPWPAYKYTVEHSLYVAADHRCKGIGRQLLAALIERATQQNFHVMVGVIDSSNAASIALHERFGFQQVGMMREVGFKFGTWLDLCFYQRNLPTPERPIDG